MKPVAVCLPDGWQGRVNPAWLKGWRPTAFELEGGTTQVVESGAGPPLLLVPPLPGFKEAWIATVPALARHFRVVTFDLRVRFADRPRWEDLVDDLDRVADAFVPGPVLLVGHSLGGALAQRWALARPERVAALVLSSSFARVGSARGYWAKRYVEQPLVLASQRFLPERLAAPMARWLAARHAWVYDARCDERTLSFVRYCIRAIELPLARRLVTLAFEHDVRATLAHLRCPTLLVVGERETPWARAATSELSRLLPDAALRMSPATSHLHPLSAPEWFADTVHEWLASGMPGHAEDSTAAAASP